MRQIDGPGRARHLAKCRPRERHLIDGIVQHLGNHTSSIVASMILLVVFVELVRLRTQLIGARIANGPNDVLDIKLRFDEILRQRIQ